MPFYAGDVLIIFCDGQRLIKSDPKDKYLVCVDPNRLLFFFINSDPFRKLPDTQIAVTPDDLDFLTNDVSYIDTRQPAKFTLAEIDPQLKRQPWRNKGQLPVSLRNEMRNAALAHGLLYPWQEDLIRKNFGDPEDDC